MASETLLLYVGTMLLVVLLPGPTVLCVVAQAGRFGFRRAMAGVAGIQAGHLVLFGCVAAGLASAFAAGAGVLEFIRYVGAGYLIYLGLRLVVASADPDTTLPSSDARAMANGSLFLQAFATQVSNPKAFLFVSAYLPQFIRPDSPLLYQVAILFAVTVALETTVLVGYAYLSARSLATLRASRAGRWLERVLGAAFVYFGMRMLLDRK